MIDAYDYCPEIDDVAGALDEASLWYAAQKSVQALDDARVALQDLGAGGAQAFDFDWETPLGWIRVRGGGDDTVDGTDALLIVDLGGNDTYTGGVAASTADRPLGLLLDLAGNDTYESDVPAQGAGLTGVGILLDAAGDDGYRARHYAQGVGQFGLGLLADLGGDDVYVNRYSGQGCGYFGIGLLFDVAGEDEYTLWADGQGLGGVAGVGVLADRTGDDTYTAVREHSVTGRPSYHSPGLDVGVSNAQGSGMGRRGDGADGHSWAGAWERSSMVAATTSTPPATGQWAPGTGSASVPFTTAAATTSITAWPTPRGRGPTSASACSSTRAATTSTSAEVNSHSDLAWAHDFTVAILLDGGGDDLYSVRDGGLAYSINRSVAALIDIGGDDVYETEEVPQARLRAQRRALPVHGAASRIISPTRRRSRSSWMWAEPTPTGASSRTTPTARPARLAQLEGPQLQHRRRPRRRPGRSDADPGPRTIEVR